MRSEKIKTPLTKPATPVSKRSGEMKAVALPEGEGQGVATIEQWDSQRAMKIPELDAADVQLIEEGDGAPTAPAAKV
jgi:hypothetical protein